MKASKALTIALLAGSCLVPVQVRAQDAGDSFDIGSAPPPPKKEAAPVYENEVDVGTRYQSGNSAKYGRYNGFPDQGGQGIGGFELRQRDAWDSGGTRYFEAYGRDLSFDGSYFMPNASAGVKYGDQGKWGINLFYDGDTWFQSQSFKTIYPTSGALAPGVAPASTPWYNSSALLNSLATENAKTKRDKFGGSAVYLFDQVWSFKTSMDHEHKEGTLEQSLLFGSQKNAILAGSVPQPGSGGNLVYFPQPVDYDTDRFIATLALNRPTYQAEFSYIFSNFTDNLLNFKAFDPFNNPGTNGAGAATSGAGAGGNLGPGAIAASYSLPPSNSAHQVKALLGYNPTPTVRLNANLAYSVMMQNESYAPETYNPNVNIPSLPRNSFDGKIQNFFGNLSATARPYSGVDLRASYTADDRENDSPRNVYKTIENDAAGAGTGYLGNSPFTNMPISYRSQTIKLDAGYRFLPGTKLSLGYVYKLTDRDYAIVNHNTENTISARVNSNLAAGVNAMLGYEHSVRTASNVNLSAPWLALGYAAKEGDQLGFYDAPRTSDTIRTYLSAMPREDVTLGLNAKFTADNYYTTQNPTPGTPATANGFGLSNDHTLTIGPDLSWQPAPEATLHAFYNYEEIFRGQSGPGSTSAAPNNTTPANGNWTEKTNDQVQTVGLSGDWQAIPDLLKIGANYNLSYGDTSYLLGDGVTTAVGSGVNYLITQMPNVKSTLNSIGIHGEYQVAPGMSVWLGYNFERFIYSDPTIGYAATTYGNALLPGDTNPSYAIHVIAMQFRVKW